MTEVEKLAQTIRASGTDVRIEDIYGPTGVQRCLVIGGWPYPLWELNADENRTALERMDFDAIRNRRGPYWTIARPIKLGPQ
jgi:hypothetical protein